MSIGERIRKRRKELNLSVETLALKLKKNRATIYRYESDEIENLPITIIEPLANVLMVTPGFLMGWDDILSKDTIDTIKSPGASAYAPLYGSIAAGIPLEMIEVEEMVELPEQIKNKYPNGFFLTVRGDSMNKIVQDGTLAFIQPCKELNNGDIGAITVNQFDATLKRFHKLTDSIVLEPLSHNQGHHSQIYNCNNGDCDSIHIIGKLVWYMAPANIKF